MGYMRHHAIVVTSWKDDVLEAAHVRALEIFKHVAPVTPAVINGYRTFLVAPDGSKEGWDESDAGDIARGQFIDWLNAQRYGDGSSYLQWVEVQFGDDNRETRIVHHGDESVKQQIDRESQR
jgi:hypothetical protein